MIKIFGKRIAEMRDIEDAKKEVLENMKTHFEKVDKCLEVVGYRLDTIDKNHKDLSVREKFNALGITHIKEREAMMDKYLSAFADEVFLHLPAKKSNVPLEYHHKRVAKALDADAVKQVKQEAEQAEREA